MNISINAETQKLLEEQLKSGKYGSPSEVVHAALSALEELEAYTLDQETLDVIDRAEDQIEQGNVQEWKDVKARISDKFIGK